MMGIKIKNDLMKKYKFIYLALFFGTLLISSCEEEQIVFDAENGQTLAQFSSTSVDLGTPAEGASVDIDVTVTTKTNSERTISIMTDPSSTATTDQYTIAGDLVIPAGSFIGTLTINSNFNALPESGSVVLVLNLTDVSGSNDIVFTNSTLSVELFRECPPAPAPGDWIVDMHDSYGDGWQTTTGNGGPGITVTLSTGEVFEVGLCTPYEANTYDCIPEASDGSATITIPTGVESADWFFPGDNWGEISFQIYAPNGNLVADYPAGSSAGPIIIDFCSQ
jgi:hypothetical protein